MRLKAAYLWYDGRLAEGGWSIYSESVASREESFDMFVVARHGIGWDGNENRTGVVVWVVSGPFSWSASRSCISSQ